MQFTKNRFTCPRTWPANGTHFLFSNVLYTGSPISPCAFTTHIKHLCRIIWQTKSCLVANPDPAPPGDSTLSLRSLSPGDGAGVPGPCPHPQGPEELVLVPRLHHWSKQGWSMPSDGQKQPLMQKSLLSNDILGFYGYKKFPSTVALQFTSYKLPNKSPWQEDSVTGFGIGKKGRALILGLTRAQIWWTALRTVWRGLRCWWVMKCIFGYC